MKRLYLLLIPLLLVLALMACEGSDNNNSGTKDDINSDSQSVTSNVVSTEEPSLPDLSGLNEKKFDVPVTLDGADALANAGLKADPRTISVTVKAADDILENLTASDIVAKVDVSGIKDVGNEELNVVYSSPEGVYITDSQTYITIKITKVSVEIIPPSDTDVRLLSTGIIINGTRAMEQFGGGAGSGKNCAEKMNQFKAAVGDDVNVYILPAPLSSAFYAPAKYPNSIKNHQNCFNAIRDNLVSVKYVDALGALSSHTDENIYFRTDHHWQALGAYYAAQELARVAGTSFDSLDQYKVNSSEGVLGTYYTAYSNKDIVLKNNPDTMTWYVPNRTHEVTYYSQSGLTNPIKGRTLFSTSNSYLKFIYGDSYTTHIKSDVNNGRKILIFKDSFGNALAPFVLSSFEEVYIADFRYFKENAKTFIEEHGITDVCFSMAAFSVTGHTKYITQLLNN
jgi:hypothetical protein